MDLKQYLDKLYIDRVTGELRRADTKNLTTSHVSYHSMLYLDLIAFTADCTVSKISAALRISKSAVTIKVKELERMGLVEKQKSTEDGRVYFLKLTEKTRQEYDEDDRLYAAAYQKTAEKYSDDQLTLLREMLDDINRNLNGEEP